MKRGLIPGLLVVGAVAGVIGVRGALDRSEAPPGARGDAQPLRAPAPRAEFLGAPLPPARGARTIRGRITQAGQSASGAVVIATREADEESLSAMKCRCAETCANPLLECRSDRAIDTLAELLAHRRGEVVPLARATAAADGSFELVGLEDGRYALWAQGAAGTALREGVQAGDDGIEVALTAGTKLAGRVFDLRRRGVAGALVTAVNVRQSRFFETLSDAEGRFAVEAVPAGDYVVVALREGFLPARVSVAERAGELQLVLGAPRRISGRVLLHDGPGAGVRVELNARSGTAATCVTGADGSFAFRNLRPGPHSLSTSDGTNAASLEVELGAGADRDDVVLRLEQGVAVTGTVRDGQGAPIAGATMTVAPDDYRDGPRCTTGDDGRCRVGPLPRGPRTVRVQAPGFLSPEPVSRVFANADEGVEFALTPSAPLRGVVTGPDGEPVARAVIEAMATSEALEGGLRGRWGRGMSEADGTFSVEGLEAATVDLTVRADDFAPAQLTVRIPNSAVRVTLARGAELTGRVIDQNGNTMAQVTVTAFPRPAGEESGAPMHTLAMTDERGEFALRGLEDGTYSVVATQGLPTHRTKTIVVEVKRGAPARATLQFAGGVPVTGRVQDDAGRPIAGASVFAAPEASSSAEARARGGEDAYTGGTAQTGDDGAFAIPDLQPGNYELRVAAEGFVSLEAHPAVAGGKPALVTLARVGHVVGRVVRASDGTPLVGFEVNAAAFEDGVFDVEVGSSGKLELTVTAPGFVTQVVSVDAQVGTTVRVADVALSSGRTLAVRVVDAVTGAPAAAVAVFVLEGPRAPPALIAGDALGLAATANGISGPDGSLVLEHVAEGGGNLLLRHRDYRSTHVAFGSETSLVAKIDPGGVIEGLALFASGAPMTGLNVEAQGPEHAQASIGTDGRYALKLLAPGTYRVMVLPGGYGNEEELPAVQPRTVEVAGNGVVRVDFRERSGGGSVLVRITDAREGGLPLLVPGEIALPGSFEQFERLLGQVLLPSRQAPSDPGGYRFVSVPAGGYTLLVAVPNHRDESIGLHRQIVTLSGAGEEVVEVRLPAELHTLRSNRKSLSSALSGDEEP